MGGQNLDGEMGGQSICTEKRTASMHTARYTYMSRWRYGRGKQIPSVFARVQQSDHSRRKMRNLTDLSAEFFIPLCLCREKR